MRKFFEFLVRGFLLVFMSTLMCVSIVCCVVAAKTQDTYKCAALLSMAVACGMLFLTSLKTYFKS